MTPIHGLTRDGKRVWYTGKSGEAFVSKNHEEAFQGYNLEGAKKRATILNKMTGLHGIEFVAVEGALLNLFPESK